MASAQSPTTVLLRTPVTLMIIFNQGMLLLGSNYFLVNTVQKEMSMNAMLWPVLFFCCWYL